jgi:cytochrome c-type biogenesis protein CcmF
VGSLLLLIAFLISLGGIVVSLAGSIEKRRSFIRGAELIAAFNFVLVTFSSALLVGAFLSRDFSLLYVLEHSSLSLSGVYTVTAFWAGQEGSLLLWTWLLTFSVVLVIRQNRDAAPDLTRWAVFVLMIISTFFLAVLNFVSNPFQPFQGPVPADGYGLNPLLQNPGMVIHPPMLFIGYAGLTVLFSFTLASLLSCRKDTLWIARTRSWTMISWFFLGAGILLGARWAYVELGWGGYWGWDPVENASLMPWLTLTAFLHSATVEERRGMFRLWNVNLAIVTYFLVIFGTFITHSGIFSSVHAYGKSGLGSVLLVYMVFILLASLAVLWTRRDLLVSEARIHTLFSREGALLLNNLIFSIMAFSVLWGTVFPVLSGFFTGVKVTVGPSFYNRVNLPMVLLLMVLMGICPLLEWKNNGSGRGLARALALPLILAAATASGAVGAGIRNLSTVLVFSFAAFITGSVLVQIYRGIRIRIEAAHSHLVARTLKAFWVDRRRYGGHVVHLGVALMLLGISGAPLTVETQGTIRPGESMMVGGYTIQYREMIPVPDKDSLAITARLLVLHKGESAGWLIPEKRFFAKWEDKPTSEVSILSSWKEDLYMAMTGYKRDGEASFRVLINPFVAWLWLGGYVIAIGTFLAAWPGLPREGIAIHSGNVP